MMGKKKSSSERIYDRAFKAGYNFGSTPKKKPKPRQSSGGGGRAPIANPHHAREHHVPSPSYAPPQTRQQEQEVKVVWRQDGKTDTYFGGQGRADGRGHGHVVTRPDGGVDYARESDGNGGWTYIDRR